MSLSATPTAAAYDSASSAAFAPASSAAKRRSAASQHATCEVNMASPLCHRRQTNRQHIKAWKAGLSESAVTGGLSAFAWALTKLEGDSRHNEFLR